MGNSSSLNIDSATINLKENKHFTFDDVSIYQSKLKRNQLGLYSIKSNNNIIISNSTIDCTGVTNSNRKGLIDMHQINTTFKSLYGEKLNQIFIGKKGSRGDSCSGGNGGCGIKIECNKLIMENSTIDTSGCDCCNGGSWGCGKGQGGSCLIICDE
eukprot:773762_1